MTRKLYLHIGAQRTATTSLQRFFRHNAKALQRRGLLYPYGVARHNRQIARLFRGDWRAAEFAADLTARADDKPHAIDRILLSDEGICRRADLAPLRGLQDHFDLRVIYCLRRQDLWLESWYLQNIKWQWDPKLAHLTLDAFLQRRGGFFWIDYAAYALRLERHFGAENVDLMIFEPGQMPEGPVAAFCDRIGVRDRSGLAPPPRANPSFPPVISEFMRCLPLDAAPPDYRAVLERACAEILAERPELAGAGPTLLLGAAERRSILSDYAAGNAALARRRFGRETLFFDPLPPEDAPVADLTLPDGGYEVMERLVAPFLRRLIALEAENGARGG